MRNPFHKRTTLEKIASPVEQIITPLVGMAPRLAKSGLTAAGTVIGVSLASAALSRVRQRHDEE